MIRRKSSQPKFHPFHQTLPNIRYHHLHPQNSPFSSRKKKKKKVNFNKNSKNNKIRNNNKNKGYFSEFNRKGETRWGGAPHFGFGNRFGVRDMHMKRFNVTPGPIYSPLNGTISYNAKRMFSVRKKYNNNNNSTGRKRDSLKVKNTSSLNDLKKKERNKTPGPGSYRLFGEFDMISRRKKNKVGFNSTVDRLPKRKMDMGNEGVQWGRMIKTANGRKKLRNSEKLEKLNSGNKGSILGKNKKRDSHGVTYPLNLTSKRFKPVVSHTPGPKYDIEGIHRFMLSNGN